MTNTGILMHVRHLETVGWEQLVWGVPQEDSLGSLTKTAELMLRENSAEPISVVVFGSGPSQKDGLTEGEYAKRYLLDNLRRLSEFQQLKELTTQQALERLQARVENIVVVPIERSIDEITSAAAIFAEHSVTRVYQVASASHAPRCVQIQAAARAKGFIPQEQTWHLITDDRCYLGADPFSTFVAEPPHRGDDPMLTVSPSLPEALRDYQYGLSVDEKKELVRLIHEYMRAHAKTSGVREFAKSS